MFCFGFLKYLFIYLFWLCRALVVGCVQDLVPRPGMEPGPPALAARSLTHWTTREVPRRVQFFETDNFMTSYQLQLHFLFCFHIYGYPTLFYLANCNLYHYSSNFFFFFKTNVLELEKGLVGMNRNCLLAVSLKYFVLKICVIFAFYSIHCLHLF